jgi:hypothetical protein
MFPEVYALKQLVAETKKSGKILLFLDLHGHSILKNSFIYGPNLDEFMTHPCNYKYNLVRFLALTLWHNSKYFKFTSCKFDFCKEME